MGDEQQDIAPLGGPGNAPAATGSAEPAPAAANPAALTIAQAARLLGVGESVVRDHIAAGAPTAGGQPDGAINLVHYVAWMNLRLKERDGD